MTNKFKLDEQAIIKIGNLLPRLKHSVSPVHLIEWLENFDIDEFDSAIDLLSVFEYIPFKEFMLRLNDLLNEIFKTIPNNKDKIIIIPYGKLGKSGTLVTYPLKNTRAFKRRESVITLTNDYTKVVNPKSFRHIIFLDDFIGSGKTFVKEFSKEKSVRKWIHDNRIENIYILSTIIMIEGRDYVLSKFPHHNIKIHAEERNKIFHKTLSPLSLIGDINKTKDITQKHGDKIPVFNFPPYSASLGFDASESLVSYFHCTPNNTLPIIWGKTKDWKPLFPREAHLRMDEARQFKNDIAFYIGICNKLGIDLYTGRSIISKKQDKYVRERKHNNKLDHSVVALLFLKKEGYDNLIICHLLGITRTELIVIYNEAKKLNFINKRSELTISGINFLVELKKRTKPENFRKQTKHSLRVKNELYMPIQFNGTI
ncbi:hypothetical protein DFQ09_103324 [Winogradskyella pacifica]|uniref:Uncharacterized protein n=1 Tax=Winogradskyella pacifica TaxID=664642 RepID=A0A3D9N0A8_9FLAO|nr:hypothetical protein [Winogradskyella pacifica]REE25017.1 hypothetical protein DFQ09_103324 [Winogradskyella pacifica]